MNGRRCTILLIVSLAANIFLLFLCLQDGSEAAGSPVISAIAERPPPATAKQDSPATPPSAGKKSAGSPETADFKGPLVPLPKGATLQADWFSSHDDGAMMDFNALRLLDISNEMHARLYPILCDCIRELRTMESACKVTFPDKKSGFDTKLQPGRRSAVVAAFWEKARAVLGDRRTDIMKRLSVYNPWLGDVTSATWAITSNNNEYTVERELVFADGHRESNPRGLATGISLDEERYRYGHLVDLPGMARTLTNEGLSVPVPPPLGRAPAELDGHTFTLGMAEIYGVSAGPPPMLREALKNILQNAAPAEQSKPPAK